MEITLTNAGNGLIVGDTCLSHAIADVAAFLDDLGMKDPPVAVTMQSPRHDGTGRYSFVLHRGIRLVDVEMPGLPLDEVRCTEDFMPRGCPRLYVDGDSWLWCYALDCARVALADHDGAVEQRRVASERAARAALDRQPRCATCNSVRSLTGETGLYEVRCYACEPEVETRRETPGGTVYMDDSWTRVPHYLVRRKRLPPEVPGHENPMHPDALCGSTMYTQGTGICRRNARHEGRCEPYWREVERTFVAPKAETGMNTIEGGQRSYLARERSREAPDDEALMMPLPAWVADEVRRSYKLVHDAVDRVTFRHAGIPTFVVVTLEDRSDGTLGQRGRLHVTLVTRHRDSGEEIAIQFGDDIPLTISTPEDAFDFVYDRARHAWVHELNEALHVDGERRRDLHVGAAATINLRITEELNVRG